MAQATIAGSGKINHVDIDQSRDNRVSN